MPRPLTSSHPHLPPVRRITVVVSTTKKSAFFFVRGSMYWRGSFPARPSGGSPRRQTSKQVCLRGSSVVLTFASSPSRPSGVVTHLKLEEKRALGFVAEANLERGGRGNVPANQLWSTPCLRPRLHPAFCSPAPRLASVQRWRWSSPVVGINCGSPLVGRRCCKTSWRRSRLQAEQQRPSCST